MEKSKTVFLKAFKSEDLCSIWVGFTIIFTTLIFYWLGINIEEHLSTTPGTWNNLQELISDLTLNWIAYTIIYVLTVVVFSLGIAGMGGKVIEFALSYTILFMSVLFIFYFASWSIVKSTNLVTPLIALIAGLAVGSIKATTGWFKAALRTEYYIKSAIVLLGATLPFSLIIEAGPIAFTQATIVSIATWITIFLTSTKIFKLDPRFAAVMGAGGAVCGVSASIAVSGAVKAKKDHIAVAIGVVSIWAILMIFVLSFITELMISADVNAWYKISPGEAGAWVGSSAYADAAGFAVVENLSAKYGEVPIKAFTLVKVIGRDTWVGIWAFILSIISILYWEETGNNVHTYKKKVDPLLVWRRLPKFILGFIAASMLMSYVSWDEYKKQAYQPNPGKMITTEAEAGQMDKIEIDSFRPTHSDSITQLNKEKKVDKVKRNLITPIKKLRSWIFILCFFSIGVSTNIGELLRFGMKPFWVFSAGAIVNVILGYILSTKVFTSYWINI